VRVRVEEASMPITRGKFHMDGGTLVPWPNGAPVHVAHPHAALRFRRIRGHSVALRDQAGAGGSPAHDHIERPLRSSRIQ